MGYEKCVMVFLLGLRYSPLIICFLSRLLFEAEYGFPWRMSESRQIPKAQISAYL
jgi:hypothetical protein